MIGTAALRTRRGWRAASLMAHTVTTGTRVARLAPRLSRAMTTSSEPIEKEEIRWRFPVDDRVENMVEQVKHGLTQTTMLTLNSTTPITHDLMEEALSHLYDKIESLRLCFRQRHGQLWIADMPQRKIDFQSVSGRDVEEEHYALHHSPFNTHEGPLWKVRLVPSTEDAPCYVPEAKKAFPYQCVLILSVHHAANDGIVVYLMTEVLFGIIDSLLQGSPVNSQPVGELRDGAEAREEEKKFKAALETDPQRLLAALRQHSMSRQLPLLVQAFGLQKVANPTTYYYPQTLLDIQVTDKIVAKCRSIGATFNAAFTAVLNLSTIEVAREAGFERDVYNVSSRHPVDSRRLMKDCKTIPLGFHAIPMTYCIPTPRDAKKHFWQYVKHLDTELRMKLKSNYMCEERVLDTLMRQEGYTHHGYFAHQQLPFCDFFTSNMYAPRTTNEVVGKNVQITWLRNCMSIHNDRYAMGVGVFSFRGQARFQFGCSTAAVTQEVGQRCFEKNLALLHDISEM